MDFGKIKGRVGVIYNGMWKEFPEKMEIENDNNTYRIKAENCSKCDAIKSFYGIRNGKLFDSKYIQATGGNGNEETKILTLHSSSRCSLLCFYGLDEEHTLVLNLDGKDVAFDFSAFEFKNPVIGYPSNMDVVLLSKDRKVVLFLESKFSEYYMSAAKQSSHIAERYKKNEFGKYFYDINWLKSVGIEMTSHTQEIKKDEKIIKREGFVLSTTDGTEVYLDGFKQMISHYIGIRRRMRGDSIKADNGNSIAEDVLDVVRKEGSKIYLGEILFDQFSVPSGYENELDPQKVLEKYSDLYCKLAKKMNEVLEADGLSEKFKVLPQDLKYSDVMKIIPKIEPEILTFYEIK